MIGTTAIPAGMNTPRKAFDYAIGFLSRLIPLAQQPLDVSEHFSLARDLMRELPLTECQRLTVVRVIRRAEAMQKHQEFGAARHELGLVRRNLIREQHEIMQQAANQTAE